MTVTDAHHSHATQPRDTTTRHNRTSQSSVPDTRHDYVTQHHLKATRQNCTSQPRATVTLPCHASQLRATTTYHSHISQLRGMDARINWNCPSPPSLSVLRDEPPEGGSSKGGRQTSSIAKELSLNPQFASFAVVQYARKILVKPQLSSSWLRRRAWRQHGPIRQRAPNSCQAPSSDAPSRRTSRPACCPLHKDPQ